MPLDRRAAFQLGLILLAVPAQYFITKYIATPQDGRDRALKSILTSAVSIRNKYFSWQYWQKWCARLVNELQQAAGGEPAGSVVDDGEDMGESPAIEVLKLRDNDGHFATSTTPRSPRLAAVKYRVGQVIKHKRWGYRGVIVGWDPVTKAPKSWIQQMHPPDKPEWKYQPNYAVLVDTRDRIIPLGTYAPEVNLDIVTGVREWKDNPSYSVLVDTRDRSEPQTTYVVQENIQIVTNNVKILHPELDDYFETFDGAQYIPRPWLRAIYPHD